ncbi:Alpha/Beta hydrolase protein [Chytridium lagenaria]|nr:Alpha/Beta hydrolase protein [Chytridium lagenaria]
MAILSVNLISVQFKHSALESILPFQFIILNSIVCTYSIEMRTSTIITIAGTLFAASVSLAAPLPFFKLNEVALDYGTYIASSDAQVISYLGVPYAAPPIGANRFMAPKALAASSKAFKADKLAPMCIQDASFTEATSEDCLYLNVWLPANVKPSDTLPVVVYVHGNAYPTDRRSSAPWQIDLSDIVRQSYYGDRVIAISFSYRSNVFGLFNPTEFLEKGLGNAGLADVSFVFEWVKKNIGRFGGDATKVTAVGHGMGASLVSALLRKRPNVPTAPFQKAVILSVLGESCPEGSDVIECLRGVPALELLGRTVTASVQAGTKFGLAVNSLFPATPAGGSAPDIHVVPLLVGTVAKEGLGTAAVTNAEELDILLSIFIRPEAYVALAKQDIATLPPSIAADFISGLGGNVFKYVFNHNSKVLPADRGSSFGSDLPFLFNKKIDLVGKEENALSEQLSNAFLSFVTKGSPAANWPKYTAATRSAFVVSSDPSFKWT